MKKIMIYLIFILILVSITNVLACISDVECPGGGRENCYVEDNHYIIKKSSCVNSVCQSEITKVVNCCSPNLGCPTDQVCQDGKCIGGRIDVPPVSTLDNKRDRNNNLLMSALIIAGAIIIGFIILAIILRKRKK